MQCGYTPYAGRQIKGWAHHRREPLTRCGRWLQLNAAPARHSCPAPRPIHQAAGQTRAELRAMSRFWRQPCSRGERTLSVV